MGDVSLGKGRGRQLGWMVRGRVAYGKVRGCMILEGGARDGWGGGCVRLPVVTDCWTT